MLNNFKFLNILKVVLIVFASISLLISWVFSALNFYEYNYLYEHSNLAKYSLFSSLFLIIKDVLVCIIIFVFIRIYKIKNNPKFETPAEFDEKYINQQENIRIRLSKLSKFGLLDITISSFSLLFIFLNDFYLRIDKFYSINYYLSTIINNVYYIIAGLVFYLIFKKFEKSKIQYINALKRELNEKFY